MMTSNTRQFGLSACGLKLCACFISTITLLTSLAAVSMAQTASRPDRGVRPVGSYSISDIENISLTNGNVNLSIPLASLPPIAGGDLSWVLRAEYSSKLWDKPGLEIFQAPPLSNYTHSFLQLGDSGGWRIGGRYFITLHQVNEDYQGIPPANEQDPDWQWRGYKWKMILTTPDGAKHELRPVDYPSYPIGQGNHDYQRGFYQHTPAADSVNATMRYYSFDGSYIWAKIDPFPAFGFPHSWSVYLPDGTTVEHNNGIQRIKDTNGNKIKIWSDTVGAISTTHYQDELTSREIKFVYDSQINSTQVQYQTVGGSWISIDINYGTTSVHGMTYLIGDPCLIEQEVNTDIPVIRSIVFPLTKPGAPRLQYTFSYNSDTNDSDIVSRRLDCAGNYATINNPSHGWGSLSQMVTPQGATLEYSYQWDGNHSGLFDPNLVPRESITQKRVTHDGITDTWDYSIGLAAGEVKGPDGSITTETFYSHDPGLAAHLGGIDGRGGLVYRTERKLGPGSNPIKQVTTERHWIRLIFSGGNDDAPGSLLGFNTVVDAEYTTLHNSSGTPTKMSAKTFQHDYNGNVIQITEYDWFDPSLISRDAAGVPTGVPSHPSVKVLRTTVNSYYNQATTANSPNVYSKRTLPSGAPLILNALQQTAIGDSQTRYSYDGLPYGTPPTSGNLTKESRWDNINSQWLDMTYTYDSYGNKTSMTDPSGAVTQYFYEDSSHANQTKVVVNPGTSPATEQATTMFYDYDTGALLSRTDPNGKTTNTDYTNQLLGTPDPYLRPGVVTAPPVSSFVDGLIYTNQRHKTRTTYDDNLRQVTVESDLNTQGDYKLKTRTTTDQLGRTVLGEKNEDGTANYTISNQTVYVQMGKITLASNPKRSGAATMDGWVRTTRDDLGRVIEVATFSNAAQPPATGTDANWTGSITTTYNANETTVKDQANKERRSVADALGRLTQVIENPNGSPAYTTDYTYDQLGNLRKAAQGSQTRFFMFDSLSRLIRTKNPEQEVNTSLSLTDPATNNSQWAIAYSYFPNGNLQSKTNARDITTSYSYDKMNRNLTVDYSDTAVNPDITRVYDGAFNGKGRLQKSYAGGNETVGTQVERNEISQYDAVGRSLQVDQSFKTGGAWGFIYSTSRLYDLAGNPTRQSYPSGRTVDYVYDNAGRVNTFKGTLGGTFWNYVLGTTYNAAGGRTREQFGTSTNIYHHLSYTSRGHLFDARIGTGAVNDGSGPSWNRGALRIYYSSNWAYGNGGNDNNGNVYRAEHFIPLDVNVSQWTMSIDYYGYDAFNRISLVAENKLSSGQGEQYVFRQDYAYDQWGNRTISSSDVPGAFNLPFNVDAATNRLLAPGGGISYDKDGNQTNDSYSGGGSRSYDAENRMTAAQGHAYAYDADGRRARRAISGGSTYWQVFGVAGELVAEYAANALPSSPTKEYGYRGGQLLITAESARVKWMVGDQLGTPRMVVDQSGDLLDNPGTPSVYEGVIRHDYLPFGEEIGAGVGIRTANNGYVSDGIRQKFTGKDRDSETGLDYFEARYYAGKQGRFTSPDEFSGGPDELFDFVDVASENPTIYADLTEPQSLNKYQYCYNNPLSFIDIDGHKGWREWLKTGLEVASYIPGPIGTGASLVQAGVALAQGDYKGALVAAAGVVPGGKVLAKAGAAIGAAVVVGVAVRKISKAADASATLKKVAKQVDKVHGALDPIGQEMRTTAVGAGRNAEGKVVHLAGGGATHDLTRAQRDMAKKVGAEPVALPGKHGEVTVYENAKRRGVKLDVIQASRPICPECEKYLKRRGATLIDERTATFRH